MNYGSVCSGIEAATVAWHPLGWVPAWFSEIEPFPCMVLQHHYPGVPNLGDMMQLRNNKTFINGTIDILVGGTPCQSFSIAGLRAGLADDRGNLALEFCRLLIAKRPRWFIWENVPGALSSFSNEKEQKNTETSDFATILTAFRECGYSCAYRVLDAQYFGVPQRRRRIFVVGYFGNDWRPPAAVLFEPESLRRNSKASRKKKKNITGALGSSSKGRSPGVDEAAANQIIYTNESAFGGNNCSGEIPVSTAIKGNNQKFDFESETFVLSLVHRGGNGSGVNVNSAAYTLDKSGSAGQAVLAYPYNQITSKNNRSNPQPGDPAPTLTKNDNSPLIIPFAFDLRGREDGAMPEGEHDTANIRSAGGGSSKSYIVDATPRVRRLTPLECERLQGFPDYYTLIDGSSDTSRYEAIGNSMAVPVMHWIGKRIDIVDKFLNK